MNTSCAANFNGKLIFCVQETIYFYLVHSQDHMDGIESWNENDGSRGIKVGKSYLKHGYQEGTIDDGDSRVVAG
ncbi:hypothetical protein J1N35_013248 [Gossypium stocksii]|uniref:Uncharacterized protein n=1 Tax=Gossypium stocksii TaxID=47602 RepID=A0A9D3VSC7_9ROSI|nr:hypothetical protein J1N35_013248 [Gossypium stocksii]